MKSLILALALTLFSTSIFASASDYGWRHFSLTSKESTNIAVDVRLTAFSHNQGTIYNSDVWVHIGDAGVSEAKVVVLNFVDGNSEPSDVKEINLTHNKVTGVFEAPLSLQVSAMRAGELVSSRQEIAIRINGNQWLKNQDNQSNFGFSILDIYGIQN